MGIFYYTGCFLDSASSDLIKTKRPGKALSNPNEILHMTIQFQPESINEALFGERISIRVIGYGIDEENEGFLVEAHSDNHDVQRLIDTIEIPHITMSISANGKHRNTRNLQFDEIEPFYVSGRYGGFIRGVEGSGYLVFGEEDNVLVTSKDIDTDDVERVLTQKCLDIPPALSTDDKIKNAVTIAYKLASNGWYYDEEWPIVMRSSRFGKYWVVFAYIETFGKSDDFTQIYINTDNSSCGPDIDMVVLGKGSDGDSCRRLLSYETCGSKEYLTISENIDSWYDDFIKAITKNGR